MIDGNADLCTVCGFALEHHLSGACFDVSTEYGAWIDGETQMRDERAVTVPVDWCDCNRCWEAFDARRTDEPEPEAEWQRV